MLSLCSCARRSTSRIFLIDTLFVGIGCPPLFLLTEVADQLIRVSTGAMPARLSPAVRDHRNDCPEIDWIECPHVALNLQGSRAKTTSVSRAVRSAWNERHSSPPGHQRLDGRVRLGILGLITRHQHVTDRAAARSRLKAIW